jgi:hypothetical protein
VALARAVGVGVGVGVELKVAALRVGDSSYSTSRSTSRATLPPGKVFAR